MNISYYKYRINSINIKSSIQSQFTYSQIYWQSHPVSMSHEEFTENVLSKYISVNYHEKYALYISINHDIIPPSILPKRSVSLIYLAMKAHLANIANCDSNSLDNPDTIRDIHELYQIVGLDTSYIDLDIHTARFPNIHNRCCLFGNCLNEVTKHSIYFHCTCCSEHGNLMQERVVYHKCIICGVDLLCCTNKLSYVIYNIGPSWNNYIDVCQSQHCSTLFSQKAQENYLVWLS